MTAGLSHKQQRVARKSAMAARAERAAAMAVSGAKASASRRVAPAPPKVEDRDGLLWLIQKGKLSNDERRGCEAYRAAYRCPPAGSIRSCIDPTRGDGSGDMAHLDGVAQALDAARRLERYRTVCLAGDAAAIMLMDAVSGGGLTVQAYLGTADSRAVLEAVTVLRMSGRLVGALHKITGGELTLPHPAVSTHSQRGV
jgi:hypothetical protein